MEISYKTNHYVAKCLKNDLSFPTRKGNDIKRHACDHESHNIWSTRFHVGIDEQPVPPCSVQKARVGQTYFDYFLLCPVINRETKFPFTIKALVILSVLYWETKVKSMITLQYRG